MKAGKYDELIKTALSGDGRDDMVIGRINIELQRWVNIAKVYGISDIPAASDDLDYLCNNCIRSGLPLPKGLTFNSGEKIDSRYKDYKTGAFGAIKND